MFGGFACLSDGFPFCLVLYSVLSFLCLGRVFSCLFGFGFGFDRASVIFFSFFLGIHAFCSGLENSLPFTTLSFVSGEPSPVAGP